MSEATRRLLRRLKGGWHRITAISLPAVLLACVSGCTTTSHHQAVQFEPAPRDNMGVQELEPIEGLAHRGHGDHPFSPLVVPNPLPEPVLAEIRELQNDYPGTFQRGLNRASKYEGPLRARLCEAGLPEDLIWMAMVESMFQNKIVSPAGAGGMWQFVPSTARRYQLRMDSYVDERYNWERCTEAAIEYLKNLHDFFDGRWDLAITAYNMGEGGLSRAIAANGGETDFFKLIQTPPASDRIRMESKKYYPRLLAYIVVTANPEKYGFTRGTEPPDDVDRVPVQGMYSLAKLDQALGFAPNTLEQLNPDLLRDATPPSGEYRVAVPKADKERFLAALQTVPTFQPGAEDVLLASGKYKVRKGDTVAKIAGKLGLTEKELLAANGLKSSKSVRPGRVLTIPSADTAKGGASAAPPAPAESKAADPDTKLAAQSAAPAPSVQKTYKVRKGDTLAGIAASNKTTVAQLTAWNKLGKKGVINAGQTLIVAQTAAPAARPEPAADPDSVRYHVVAAGEYPAAIAKLYNLDTEELLRMNGRSKNGAILVGERLVVGSKTGSPAEAQRAETAAREEKKNTAAPAKNGAKTGQQLITVSHKVSRGETIAAIAAKHGVKTADLMACNKLTAKSVIKEGQDLIVRKPAADGGRETGSVKVAKAGNDQGGKVVHTVAAGQNPSKIATQYGVTVSKLYEWNGWSKDRVLQVGDAVVIYRK